MTPQIAEYPIKRHKKLSDLTGTVFSRLTVVRFLGINKRQGRDWLCRCTCGTEIVVPTNSLTTGNTRSCGCLAKENRQLQKGVLKPWNALPFGVAARNALARRYKDQAKIRGVAYNLPLEVVLRLLEGSCHYCGIGPSMRATKKEKTGYYMYNGIDRIDNARGYEIDNVVSCCQMCNIAKNDYPYQEFRDWIERAFRHLVRSNQIPGEGDLHAH